MPPKQKKIPTKGKKTPSRAASTTSTNSAATAATKPSARHLQREARGEPHVLGKLRNVLSQRRCRAKKRTQASPAWLAATPAERIELERAAVLEVMAGQDLRARAAASGTKMGRGYGGWKGKEEERGEEGGAEGGAEEDEEDAEMEDLPVDGPDDTPGFWGRRGGDDDDEEGAGAFAPAPGGGID
ncbi:hypothetical protein NHQ30_009706 [Ciborinia camelliae]|nr:hypothetical protein NHQ30_009706 [Ciborinia camelliae]